MSFLLDDAAFGGQAMCGAGQPAALGVGDKKIRGSMFVEAPMQWLVRLIMKIVQVQIDLFM